MIYYVNKLPEKCLNSGLVCKFCGTQNFTSYFVTKEKKKYFLDDFFEKDFVSFTNRTFYEKNMFEVLSADIVFKHASFKSFCDSINSIFSNKFNKRGNLIEVRIVESWHYYNFLKYKVEFQNERLSKLEAPFIENIDDSLKQLKNELLNQFCNKWAQHSRFCSSKTCSKTLNIDGNWKTNRLKCGYDATRVVS
jgi:hypothetical protein